MLGYQTSETLRIRNVKKVPTIPH